MIDSQLPALRIEKITKTFLGKRSQQPTVAVDALNLEIQSGEIFGLLGPNGAGKSTTINLITGVTRKDQGSISVFGFDNEKDFRTTRRLIGVMHQEIVSEGFFNVDQLLKIHSGYYGVKDDPQWRNLLVERLALGPHLEKKMMALSGGMKRRLMLAKALLHRPKLLILDEPTAGVDVELRRTLWEFVREMNQNGTTILLTTHYLEEAEQMCGRIAIMNHGKVIALDQTRGLMKKMDKKLMTFLVEKLPEELPAILKGLGARRAKEGNTLVFEVNKQIQVGDVLSALQTTGLKILDVESKMPSLEEVFLNLTSGGKGST